MNKSEIRSLINLKTEGAYWDFKREWYSNNSDQLHDIICMANNLEDRDAYIIIGVTNSGDICGVSEINRKNQQNLIDFLKSQHFAGGIRPTVYVDNMDIDGKTVDVITIKNTANTPYYLEKEYMGLYLGNIYTRIVDTNTPKDSTADIDKVEWLWKKRLGLIGDSERRIKCVLSTTGWICEDAGEYNEHFFHESYPEIRVDVNEEETALLKDTCTGHDCFFYLYSNILFWDLNNRDKLTRKLYDIHWHGNKLYQFYTLSAPKMDFDFVEPEIKFLNSKVGILLDNGSGLGMQYAYFLEDGIRYMLLKMMLPFQIDDTYAVKYGNVSGVFCSKVIPVFKDNFEYSTFMDFIVDNRVQFKKEYNELNIDKDMFLGAQAKSDPRIARSFKLGMLLVKWLEEKRVNGILCLP